LAQAFLAIRAVCLGARGRANCPHPTAMSSADLDLVRAQLALRPTLKQKLVAHRGWHRDHAAAAADRPLENTRQAYLDAAALDVAYAECDVWVTRDEQLVLSHDFNFQAVAEDPSQDLATRPIAELRWEELRRLRLRTDCKPVLLLTVLQDLLPTSTRLAIELKSSSCAPRLAACLAERPELSAAVGFVLSFSLGVLEAFAATLGRVAADTRLVWIVDNPRVPYSEGGLDEGETTFDYSAESLPDFLERTGLTERVRMLGCGLYLQYNLAVTAQALFELRAALRSVSSCGMLGLWSDRSLDPGIDSADALSSLLPALDLANSDLPGAFFGSTGVPQPIQVN